MEKTRTQPRLLEAYPAVRVIKPDTTPEVPVNVIPLPDGALPFGGVPQGAQFRDHPASLQCMTKRKDAGSTPTANRRYLDTDLVYLESYIAAATA